MKKLIYIWALCIGGLLFGQQSFAQRGHNSHGSSKQYHKAMKKYTKQRAKAYKNYSKRGHDNYSRGSNRHYNTPKYRNNARSHYYGDRVVRAPHYRSHHRSVPWGARHHYRYAHHVYFPDYQTFYDARREGYVYRRGDRWLFSQSMPSFLVGINWNNARLEYMNNVPLDVYPQNYYDTYQERYPAVSFNLNIGL